MYFVICGIHERMFKTKPMSFSPLAIRPCASLFRSSVDVDSVSQFVCQSINGAIKIQMHRPTKRENNFLAEEAKARRPSFRLSFVQRFNI
jgi:hypothetical protein